MESNHQNRKCLAEWELSGYSLGHDDCLEKVLNDSLKKTWKKLQREFCNPLLAFIPCPLQLVQDVNGSQID